MKTFFFYLRYYLNNHWVGHVPFHGFRMWWYRSIMKIQIGDGTSIQLNACFYGNEIHQISIGKGTMINPRAVFNASAPITIGERVQIAHAVEFYTADHYPDSEDFAARYSPIRVEDNVWIGSRATILRGVTLGEGCIVGVGAVVTKSVEPYTIVGGVPARVIGKRSPKARNAAMHGPFPLFC